MFDLVQSEYQRREDDDIWRPISLFHHKWRPGEFLAALFFFRGNCTPEEEKSCEMELST